MKVRRDASENYMFCRDFQLVKWLDCNMGEVAKNCMFYIFLTGAILNNLIPDNVMGLKF